VLSGVEDANCHCRREHPGRKQSRAIGLSELHASLSHFDEREAGRRSPLPDEVEAHLSSGPKMPNALISAVRDSIRSSQKSIIFYSKVFTYPFGIFSVFGRRIPEGGFEFDSFRLCTAVNKAKMRPPKALCTIRRDGIAVRRHHRPCREQRRHVGARRQATIAHFDDMNRRSVQPPVGGFDLDSFRVCTAVSLRLF
jgi:hypothetical protein